MPRIAPFTLTLAAAVGLALTGCNPIYTNVPPLTGDTAFHSPNTGSVVAVEAAALEYVLKRYPAPAEYAVDLPFGSIDATYAEVLRNLPAGGRRADASTEAVPTYRIAQVRIRRTRALVDVVVPENPSEQLVTVTCIKDGLGFGSWYPRTARIWRVPVEKALMMSTAGLVPADEPEDPTLDPGSEPQPEPTPPDAPDAPQAPAEPEATKPAVETDGDTLIITEPDAPQAPEAPQK